LLTWVDRRGMATPISSQPREYQSVHLSPDGQRLAVDVGPDGEGDTWIVDLVREIPTRLPATHGVRWSPDGTRMAFSLLTGSVLNTFVQPTDSDAPPERVLPTPHGQTPSAWTPDGRGLIVEDAESWGDPDLWMVRLEGERVAVPIVKKP